jgi:hypothetical protein
MATTMPDSGAVRENTAATSGGSAMLPHHGGAVLNDAERGATVEADGNAGAAPTQSARGVPRPQDLGPNNERLEELAPRLVIPSSPQRRLLFGLLVGLLLANCNTDPLLRATQCASRGCHPNMLAGTL